MTGDAGALFRILVVSSANVCRSPAIEMMLRTGLRGVTDIAIASAGTQALTGSPVEQGMAALLHDDGLLIDGFQSRRLTAGLLERADLVVCAARSHRADAVALFPGAARTSFTLREIERLAAAIARENMPAADSVPPSDRIRTAMPLLRLERGLTSGSPSDDDDIEDPTGRSRLSHRRALQRMIPGVEALLSLT
jgi:protein-tyrosine phosphatase